jgi:ribosome-associated protein
MEPVDGVVVTPGGRRVMAGAVTWWATRSGGPGGQHANTSDTAVTVAIDVAACGLPPHVTERVAVAAGSTITASSAGSRSQWRNRQLAWAAAMSKLDAAAAPPAPPRAATKPSRGARERRLAEKRRGAARKAERRRPTGDD